MAVAEIPSPEEIYKDLYATESTDAEQIYKELYSPAAATAPSSAEPIDPEQIYKDLYAPAPEQPAKTTQDFLSRYITQPTSDRPELQTVPTPEQSKAQAFDKERLAISEERFNQPLSVRSVTDAALLGVGRGAGDILNQAGGAISSVGAEGLNPLELAFPNITQAIPGVKSLERKVGQGLSESGDKLSASYSAKEIGSPTSNALDLTSELTSTTVGSLPVMVAAVFGGMPAAIIGGGLQSFGSVFNEATDAYMRNGDSREVAMQKAQLPAVGAGLSTAVVTALFGQRGQFRFLRNLPAKDVPQEVILTARSILKEIYKGAWEEGAEELTDQSIQSLIAFMTYRPELTFEQAFKESVKAGLLGAASGGMFNSLILPTVAAKERAGDRKADKVFGKELEDRANRVSTLLANPQIRNDPNYDPLLQQLVTQGSALTESRNLSAPTPPPLNPPVESGGELPRQSELSDRPTTGPAAVVKDQADQDAAANAQFEANVRQENAERQRVNEKDVKTIAEQQLDKLEQLALQSRLNPVQDQKRKMLRAMLANVTPATPSNLAVMLDLQLDPNEKKFPSRYRLVEDKTGSVVTGKPLGDTVTVPAKFPEPVVPNNRMTKSEITELSDLKNKDRTEDGLSTVEEARLNELQRKESNEKRRSESEKEVGLLRDEGITIPDNLLSPSDGVENRITGWTRDKNGFIQIRVERHDSGSVSSRLITVKPGDTLTHGMNDSVKGTTRYLESNPVSKGGEVTNAKKENVKAQVQGQGKVGVGATPVRVQEVTPAPVAPLTQPVAPKVLKATGSFGIRFTPVVKALAKEVETANFGLGAAKVTRLTVNNAQTEAVVGEEPGSLTVNPAKLFEETKGMTDDQRAKHLMDLILKQTEEFTGPKYAAPSTSSFYSRIVRTVEQSTQGKASGGQWKATIKNSKLGTSSDEMALVGVQDLEDGKFYTKQEVLDYLKANEVKVVEVSLGGPLKNPKFEVLPNEDPDYPFGIFRVDTGMMVNATTTRQQAEEMATNPGQFAYDLRLQESDTKFGSYQLPGAKPGTYREVLLTVPALPSDQSMEIASPRIAEVDGVWRLSWYPGGTFQAFDTKEQAEKNARDLISGLRTRRGWTDGHSPYNSIPNPIVRLRFNERTTQDGKRMLFLEEVQAPSTGQFEKMPALFQKNWREIAFKWALRYAAENGFDSIGWTTGEQQASRYDLSKQVDAISYNQNEGGNYSLSYLKGDRDYVMASDIKPESLESYVGKEVAKRIMANEGEVDEGSPDWKNLKGSDLKVGGEGLTKLYDVDFRNVVNGLPAVKKSGQKVGSATINKSPSEGTSGQLLQVPFGHTDTGESVHSIAITPAIREAVMVGQPLFAAPAAQTDSITASSVADGTRLLNGFLGTGTLPSKITVIHDPSLPWAGLFENGTVIVNMAKTSDPVAALLEEGLHGIIEAIRTGVIEDPKLIAALSEFAALVKSADLESESANRQNLDTREKTLAEEALVSKVLEANPSLVTKIYNAIRDAFKKLFGINLSPDSQTRILDAAKAWLVNENTGTTGEARFSYAKNFEQALAFERLSKTPTDRQIEANSLLAQGYDVAQMMEKHGVAALSARSKDLTGYTNFNGIAQVGVRMNGNSAYGYRQAKAASTPHQANTLAAITHATLNKFKYDAERLLKQRTAAAKKFAGSGMQRLITREATAKMKADTAEMNLKIGTSIFNSAYEQAVRALREEARTDRNTAALEGHLKGLSDASKSPEAIRQLLEDITLTLGATPNGIAMLTRTGIAVEVKAREIVAEYLLIKNAANLPLHDRNLINWAATIMVKSRNVTDKLLAQYMASQSPIRALMGAYGQQVLADLEKNPIGTVKRALRDRGRMTTANERAAFAWQELNHELMDRMKRFAEIDEAADLVDSVLKDPDFDALFKETGRDAERIGKGKAQPFLSTDFLTPSGVKVNIDPKIMVGSKTLWSNVRVDLMVAQAELEVWLQNNLDHPDYKEHAKNLATLNNYFLGQGALQPNDTMGIFKAVKKSFDILTNAVERAGGRVAAALKRAISDFEHFKLQANWWNQRWTARLGEGARLAFESHDETKTWGSFRSKDLSDVNNEWWNSVGSQLAYSHNRQSDPMQVGDLTGAGWTVTQADMNYLNLQADAAEAGFAILGDRQQTKDTLAGVIFYRKALKGSAATVPRMFNYDMRDQFAKPFSEAYRRMQLAIRNGDQAAADAARTELIQLADTFFSTIAFPMLWDRNGDFSSATVFDGPGGAFDLLSSQWANMGGLSSMDELTDLLAAYSTATKQEALDIVLNEWGKIIDAWYQEAMVEDKPDAPRSEETKNSFTRSRNQVLAPYIFYQYGFKTAHSVATFAAGIYSEQLDIVAAGVKAVIADLQRQKSDLESKIRAGGKRSDVELENRLARDAETTYDSYTGLRTKIKYAEDILELLRNDRSDTDVDIKFGRTVGALMGALISGTPTTARNVTTGPLYLGSFIRRMSASNLYGYGMGIAYSWIDAQARVLASIGLVSLPKAIFWDFPTGAFKAVGNLGTKEGWRPTRFYNTLMRGVIKEIGENAMGRIKAVKEMQAKGIHFIPEAQRNFDNILLGSMISQGRITDQDYSKLEKGGLAVVSFWEAFVAPLYKALNPVWGDTALNMAAYTAMMSSAGPVAKLDMRLRSLFLDLQGAGVTTFKDRFYSASEIFPAFQGYRLWSTKNDMRNIRTVFTSSGMDFDEEVNKFMAQLQAGVPNAQFLTDQQRDRLANTAINAANRSTGANTPLNLQAKTFINNLVSPFMHWKSRTLSNFMNMMSVPVVAGKAATTQMGLNEKKAIAWALMMAGVLLPFLVASIGVGVGDEWEARQIKKLFYNQVNATRYFWERDTAKSKWIGAFIASMNGVPFLDMAVNSAFNDMPNRASLDPSLAVVEKAKDLVRYMGGVAQTGSISYKLPELIGSILPDTKIILNRLESQSGRREANNVVALLRRSAPTDMLRPSYGGGAGVNVTPLAPIIQRMENAAVRGDTSDFQTAYQEAVGRARNDGKPNPEGYVSQLFGARSAFNRALSGKMTGEQYQTFINKLSDTDRANVAQYQQRFAQAAESIGSPVSFTKEESPSSSGGRSGTRTMGLVGGLSSGTRRSRGRSRTGRSRSRVRGRTAFSRSRTRTRRRSRRF